ncbi:MAG: hypothetical protein JRI33_07785 [Deltaproteobacteria bacterium]|nr:hypothetical protein [Deltaproteobacteria bacterium]
MRSFSMDLSWPAENLRMLPITGSPGLAGELQLEFDTTRIKDGILGIAGVAAGGLPARAEIIRVILSPLSAKFVDSVSVVFKLKSMKGDLEPFELSSLINKVQAPSVVLNPVLACKRAGDIDRNSRLDVFDLLEMLRILQGKSPAQACSDLNRDGKTDIFDLLELLFHLQEA